MPECESELGETTLVTHASLSGDAELAFVFVSGRSKGTPLLDVLLEGADESGRQTAN